MSKFIPVNDFADKYDCSYNQLFVMRYNNAFPESVLLTKRGRKPSLVDEAYFLRRAEFKKKVWNESHDLYYFLTKHLADFNLAYLLNKIDSKNSIRAWNSFLSRTLFARGNDNVLSIRLSELQWKFYRYARWLIRGLFVISNKSINNRDINILLDNEKAS